MTYKTLALALAAAALALPTLAAAQDPSTRTDLTIIGAVLTENTEQVADTNAAPTSELPIVYEDETATEAANADASVAAADVTAAVDAE